MRPSLEQVYQPVLDELQRDGEIITIELAGFPRTGKSLFADALRGLLVKCGVSVTIAPRDTWDCPIDNKWSYDYSAWTLSTLIHAWLDAKYRKTTVFIADRGWFDALLWTELKLQLKLATRAQASALRQWALTDRIWPANLVVLPFTSDDRAEILSRGKERRLHSGESRVTTLRNLDLLASSIDHETERASARGAVVRPVDVTECTVDQTIHLAADELLCGLETLVKNLQTNTEHGEPKTHAPST